MSHYPVKIGMTDKSVFVFIPDPASTDGSGKTGLVAANLTVSGSRMETDNDATVTDYTSSLNNLAALTTAHTDWGVLEVSSTLAPGLYRLDIADAIFASGAWEAVVYVMITTSAAAAVPIRFLLVPDDPYTGVNVSMFGGTSQTGADVGGIVSSGTHGNAALKTLIDAVDNFVDTEIADIQARLPAALTADGLMKADTLRVGGTLQTAGDLKALIDVVDNFVDTEIAAIITLLGTPAGASISADIATADAVADAIKAKTDSLTFTVAGKVDSNTLYINGSSNAAANLARGTLGTTLGTCDAGGTTTSVIASSLDPASAVNDQWNGKIMTFDRATTTAALRGQSIAITDYVHATLTFTVATLTTAPASGDTFTIS